MNNEPFKKSILVVDDTPENLRLLSRILSDAGYHVRATSDSRQAVVTAMANPPDLLLLDVMMPGLDGYEVCKMLREEKVTRDIPVIFLSALDDTNAKIKGFVCGGQDYIAKPFDPYEVVARVETHLSLRFTKKKLENVINELQQAMLEKEELIRQLEILASTDPLTGVNNRTYFFSMAEHEFNSSKRYERPLSVIMTDVDLFKRINDSYGHRAGDAVLVSISACMKNCLRKSDVMARYGGEEFIVFLPMSPISKAYNVAERIRENVESHIVDFEGNRVRITVSLGVADIKNGDTSVEQIIERADQALYEAKKAGRNVTVIFKAGADNIKICK